MKKLVDLALLAAAVLSGLVCVYSFFPQTFSYRYIRRRLHANIRPKTDADVNRVELRIPKLDFKNAHSDIGGWMMFHKFFEATEPVDFGQPDNGGLKFLGNFGRERNFSRDLRIEAEKAEKPVEPKPPNADWLYYEYAESIEDIEQECRRVDWKHLYHPSCNEIHEIDLVFDYKEDVASLGYDQTLDSFYISHGYYRDVWVVDQPSMGQKSILKITRWKHAYDMDTFFSDLRDALIMERLTQSPRIVDIYGHCGTAVWVEAIPYEVEEVIVPGNGHMKKEDLKDETDVNPQNDYTGTEKLEMALVMAESLADLHGFEEGVIVHDDVQLCQWLRNADGDLKLGDFNRAEIMDYDEDKREYCVYNNGRGWGNYRAPEEFAGRDLDEKIDVFSFGNNIYALLTGLWVFYENDDDEVVQKKLIGKELAYVDPRYAEKGFAESKLVEVMEKCWVYEPDKRIDIFEVVKLLREAVEENTKLMKAKAQTEH